jgi:nucleotide-binding universal stress UspA family protein
MTTMPSSRSKCKASRPAIPANLRPEALVAYGDPAEEIAKVARDRSAGLIVIGLHASSLMGPRMGSVTYRVLCLTSTLVLALPPGILTGRSRQSAGDDEKVGSRN